MSRSMNQSKACMVMTYPFDFTLTPKLYTSISVLTLLAVVARLHDRPRQVLIPIGRHWPVCL